MTTAPDVEPGGRCPQCQRLATLARRVVKRSGLPNTTGYVAVAVAPLGELAEHLDSLFRNGEGGAHQKTLEDHYLHVQERLIDNLAAALAEPEPEPEGECERLRDRCDELNEACRSRDDGLAYLRQKLQATESACADLRETVDQLTSEMAGEGELARQAEAECERLRNDLALMLKADETASALFDDNMKLRKRVAELEGALRTLRDAGPGPVTQHQEAAHEQAARALGEK